MEQIRRNTFETNSSSTHSICITTLDLYQSWCNGNDGVFYSRYLRRLLTIKDISLLKKDFFSNRKLQNNSDTETLEFMLFNEFNETYELMSYNEYLDYIKNNSFEQYVETFSPNEIITVVAFGYYGEDY